MSIAGISGSTSTAFAPHPAQQPLTAPQQALAAPATPIETTTGRAEAAQQTATRLTGEIHRTAIRLTGQIHRTSILTGVLGEHRRRLRTGQRRPRPAGRRATKRTPDPADGSRGGRGYA